ncbi:hypothetical protein JKP88DRAFT_351528 [Tribonema minus]|uniref:PH domain-containing protein n=1 Tax=Tribonema minus TaxID=303371 RepID=A0A836C6W7_9STRA|nr:hypothetical protein JKP88DRAFT_351528 [Tribonema minus]
MQLTCTLPLRLLPLLPIQVDFWLLDARYRVAVDFWLLDARYRVAVRQQRSAWAAAEGIMAGLFGRLRDLELARRACTKKAIDELLLKQTELTGKPRLLKQTELTGKPLTAQPFVAACLARVALTPEALDKHIKEEAARKATSSIAPVAPAVAAEEGAPVPPPPAPEPAAPTDMGFMDHLVASLDSPLVLASEVLERKAKVLERKAKVLERKAKVLERKAKSMTSRSFVTTLVVLTADHHLHMFDVKGKAPGSSAKATFDSLLLLAASNPLGNTHNTAAFDSLIPLIDAGARPNKTPKKYTIAPSATLDVSAFTAGKRGKQTKLVHASQFHVVEFHVVEVKANSGVKHFFKNESLSKESPLHWVKANSGVKHFFKKESLSKASLRARSEANCEEWLQRLYALCEPAAAEAAAEGRACACAQCAQLRGRLIARAGDHAAAPPPSPPHDALPL